MENKYSCPECKSTNVVRKKYHLHYGLLGSSLMKIMRCEDCGEIYNGKTGNKEGLNSYKKKAALVFVCIPLFMFILTLFIYGILIYFQ